MFSSKWRTENGAPGRHPGARHEAEGNLEIFPERAVALHVARDGERSRIVAELLRRTERTRESEALLRRALAIRRSALGAKSPGVAFALKALARTQRSAGDPAAAIASLEEALAERRALAVVGQPGALSSRH